MAGQVGMPYPASARPDGASNFAHARDADASFNASAASRQRHAGTGLRFWSARLPANSLVRNAILAGVFITGSTIGLAATWWATKPGTATDTAAIVKGIERAQRDRFAMADDESMPVTALNAGELPYDGDATALDGLASSSSETYASHVAASGAMPNESATGVDGAAQASGNTGAVTMKGKQAQGKTGALVSQASGNSGAAPAKNASPQHRLPQHRLPMQGQTQQQGMPGKQGDPILQLAEQDRKATQRSASAKRGPANNGRTVAQKKPDHPKLASTRLILARCEKKSNFILREHCKWDICNGQWGKNGCPSFEKQASIY